MTLQRLLGSLICIVLLTGGLADDAYALGEVRKRPRPQPTAEPNPQPVPTSAPIQPPASEETPGAPAFKDETQTREAVSRAYLAILHRKADPGGEDAYTDLTRRLGINGWIRSLKAMALSDEFKSEVRSKKNDEEILRQLYRFFLLRAPDESGSATYLPMIASGRTADVAVGIATSSEFLEAIERPIEEPKPPRVTRRGLVRKCGKAVCDDDGSFNALGATVMWAAWAYKNDRAKLEKNLEFLAENGFHYIRALGAVGRQPYWRGREILPLQWPDYDQVIAELTDLAYDKFGLRIEWTLIGDGDQVIPRESDRFALVDRFIAMSRGREHKIMHFEIANEGWQNGFEEGSGYRQLKRLTKHMNDRTDIMVAASAPSMLSFGGDVCQEAADYNSVADLWTFHYDRNARAIEGFWRHVRQPWESCDAFGSNNEPMGPGSSVEKTTNPYYLNAAMIVTYVSKIAMYVWHTESGVWGGTNTEEEGKSDLYENPSGKTMQTVLKLLPPGIAAWTRHNTHNNPNHPFKIFAGNTPDVIWPEGYNDGVVRAYAAVNGSDFVVIPIGIKRFAKLEAQRRMEISVYDIVTGELLDLRGLNRGEQYTLQEDGKGVYLIKGKYL